MITVIICTYNRSKLLEKTLDSLSGLDVPDVVEWELIVVDNNSKDSTKKVVENFIEQKRLPLRYVFEPQQGLSHARNRGISESAGEILAFIDDDVNVPGNWLAQVDSAFSHHDADVVGGKVILAFDQEAPPWLDSGMQKCFGSFDRGDNEIVIRNRKDGMPGIGANLCFRKNVFNAVGAFDVRAGRTGKKLQMGEETDLIRRVLANGGNCVYFPQMYLFHLVGSEKISKDYVLRWNYRMGQWEAQTDRYDNPKKQSLGAFCWACKRLISESISFIRYIVLSDRDKAFRTKVNISQVAGYVSCFLVPESR